jgi:MFS family permease
MLGLITFAQQVPIFVLATFCGAVADRSDKRQILILTQAASMLVAAGLAVLTLGGLVHEWHVFALALTLGIVNAFDVPARQSIMVELVGREDLPNTIALNSSLFNSARLVGPAIAGIVVAAVGEGWCFFLNAVSYVFVLAALLAMKREPRAKAPSERRLLAEIGEGVTFVLGHRPIRSVMMLLVVSALTGTALPTLMPIFADDILKGGAPALGSLMSGFGCGALVAGLLLASRSEGKGLAKWVITGSLCYGTGQVLFSQSVWYVPSIALAGLAGFGMIVQLAASNTLIQSIVPDRYRGRVMAIYSMMFMGMAPFGGLISGIAAERVGAPTTLLVCGICCIAGGLIFWAFLPGMRAAQARKSTQGERPAGAE